MIKLRWALKLFGALVSTPSLWATALRAVKVYAPNGWYKKFPFLPIPTAEYLEFRSHTAYGLAPSKTGGSSAALPTAHDFILYLEWFKKY